MLRHVSSVLSSELHANDGSWENPISAHPTRDDQHEHMDVVSSNLIQGFNDCPDDTASRLLCHSLH